MKKCPRCGSRNTAEILYGMPAYTEDLQKKLDSKKVVLGGCCITGMDPKYHCNDCGQDFGTPPVFFCDNGTETDLGAIKSIYFSDGGFFGGYQSILIEAGKEEISIDVGDSMRPESFKHHMTMSPDDWFKLVDALYNKLYLHEWKHSFDDPAVMDGEQWELEIRLTDDSKITYSGSNAFPPYWEELKALFEPYFKKAKEKAEVPDKCQKFIQKAGWQYAKTMPHSPHFYVVRTPENEEDFATFAEFIQQQGFPARFGEGGQEYTYLEDDGYLYWTMGNPVPETTIINRCSTFLYDKIKTKDGLVLKRNDAPDDIDKFIWHKGDLKKIGHVDANGVFHSEEEWEFIEKRDAFFAKDLTKMQLESSSICLMPGRFPASGDEVMQRLTLNQKGHVWLTRYECCGESWSQDQKLTDKIQFQVPSYAAREAFAAIKEAFSGDYRTRQYIDDHAPWYLVLTNEDGERWSTEGSPVSTKLMTKKGRLSAVLRQLFSRQDLLLFEDHFGPGPGEIILCNVSFSKGGKEYCYLAEEDLYEEGDRVIVPVGEDNQAKRARVESVQYLKPEQVSFPADKLKRIYGKAENS